MADKPGYVWTGDEWVPSQIGPSVVYQSASPTPSAVGQIWINSANNNIAYVWTGSSWSNVS